MQLEREICDLDIHSIPAIGAEPAHEHYDVRVLYRAVNITTPSPLAGDEKTKSFELSEVIDCNGPLDEQLHTDESVRRVCRQLSLHVD